MEIIVNNQPHSLSGPATLAELIQQLGLNAQRIAVEHNGHILHRDQFADTALHPGDRLEIVNFVGGG